MASIPIHNETEYTLTDDMTKQIIRDAQEHFGEDVRSIRVQYGIERHAFNARTHEVRYAFPQMTSAWSIPPRHFRTRIIIRRISRVSTMIRRIRRKRSSQQPSTTLRPMTTKIGAKPRLKAWKKISRMMRTKRTNSPTWTTSLRMLRRKIVSRTTTIIIDGSMPCATGEEPRPVARGTYTLPHASPSLCCGTTASHSTSTIWRACRPVAC